MLVAGAPIDFLVFPRITQPMLNLYAQVSGDNNRIHLDEMVAKSAGLPGVIAHGMLIAAFLAERARRFASEVPELHARPVQRFLVRFKGMTFLDDEISIGGSVKLVGEVGTILTLEARNQRQETVSVATVEFRLAALGAEPGSAAGGLRGAAPVTPSAAPAPAAGAPAPAAAVAPSTLQPAPSPQASPPPSPMALPEATDDEKTVTVTGISEVRKLPDGALRIPKRPPGYGGDGSGEG